MKAYLNRRYRFSSAHRLHSDAFTPERNAELYGKCNNPHGHGHNYFLEVTVSGPVDPATGMVCNLVDLDGFIEREVIERFDHDDLNQRPEFAALVPTTENLCVVIEEIVRRGFTHAHLEKVRIEETMMNAFEYAGGAPLQP